MKWNDSSDVKKDVWQRKSLIHGYQNMIVIRGKMFFREL